MVVRTPQLPQINLSLSSFAPPLFVDMEAFFEFSFWMSEELLDLEARFADRIVRKEKVSVAPSINPHGKKVRPR